MGPKAKRIFDEVGNCMSQESREAILSIDRMEKRIAELEGAADAGKTEEDRHGATQTRNVAGPEDGEDD